MGGEPELTSSDVQMLAVRNAEKVQGHGGPDWEALEPRVRARCARLADVEPRLTTDAILVPNRQEPAPFRLPMGAFRAPPIMQHVFSRFLSWMSILDV